MNSKFLPEISIIVPIYNAAEYLNKCIASVKNQTFTKYELILVNDGSTDESLNICRSEEQKDVRIRVINQKNSGVSKARNNGIKQAKGLYIMFLDADDWLEQTALEVLLGEIIMYEADIVCASHTIRKRFNRSIPITYENHIWMEKEFVNNFEIFFRTIATAPWGKLYKRNIIINNCIKFPDNIPYGEDTIFNLQYYMQCKTVITSAKNIYNYNFTNINSAMRKFYPEYWEYMKNIFDEYKQFYLNKKCENIYFEIEPEIEIYFYEMILDYYLLSDLKKKDKLKYIEITSSNFFKLKDNPNLKYRKYIKNKDWAGLYNAWTKQNIGKLLRSYLKKIL